MFGSVDTESSDSVAYELVEEVGDLATNVVLGLVQVLEANKTAVSDLLNESQIIVVRGN